MGVIILFLFQLLKKPLNAYRKQFTIFLKIKSVLLIPFEHLVVMEQLLMLEQTEE